MRTYARNRIERGTQVLRWLVDRFEIKQNSLWVEFQDYLLLDKKGEETHYGYVTKVKGQKVIRVSMKSCTTRAMLVETILHEFAHVLHHVAHHRHPDGYWIAYGRVFRAFHEEGGKKRSKGYSVE